MNKGLRFLLAVLFVLIFLIAQQKLVFAQYHGIWKDIEMNQSHNLFIQHYNTGATLVLHTQDAITFDVYQGHMQGHVFEAACNASDSKHLSIVFSSEENAVLVIADVNRPASEDIRSTIYKAFPAVRTVRSGIWRDASGTLALYVQDYEVGSSIVVSAINGIEFRAFLGSVSGLQFKAGGLASAAEECSIEFLGEETAKTAVSLFGQTASPQLEHNSYNILKVFRPPSLDVDFNASIHAGETPLEVEFTAYTQVPFDSWSWDFGDGSISTDKDPVHVFTAPGYYAVSMLAGMDQGLGLEVLTLRKDYIHVSEPRTVFLSGRVSDGSGVEGVQLVLSGAGTLVTDALGDYSVTLPSGWSGTVTPQRAGYSFEPPFRQFDDLKEDRLNQDFSAIPMTPPTADFTVSGSRTGPIPFTVHFLDRSTGAPLIWSWNFGDTVDPNAAQSALQNPSHVYTAGGIFTVSLVVANEWGQDTEVRSEYIIATAAPTLLSPSNGATIEPTFSLQWSAVPGAASYTAQVCEDASFTGAGIDQYSVSSVTLAVTDRPAGTGFWRVRAGYPGGYIGPWSSVRTFTVPESPPPPPPPPEVETVVLISPSNGATVTDAFDLIWNAAAGASSYRVQIASDSSFQVPWLDQNTTVTYLKKEDAPQGTHYWRVRANVSGGDPGEWSTVRSLTVVVEVPPEPPAVGIVDLVSPPNGTTVTDTFDLIWRAATGASSYRVQIASDSSFQVPWLDQNTTVTYLKQEDAPQGTHYWRVRANVSGGDPGEWSTVRSLTVVVDDPPEPPVGEPVTLVSPENNGTLCGDQTLVWSAVSGAESYRIQVAGDVGFNSLWVNRDRTYTNLSMLVSGGPFYWRVRANYAGGVPGPWSEVRYFYGPGGSAGRECP